MSLFLWVVWVELNMEWLLIIILASPTDDVELKPIRFLTRAECVAAAQEFVERYPAFEWRDRSEEWTVENPVVRSYVQCLPVSRE